MPITATVEQNFKVWREISNRLTEADRMRVQVGFRAGEVANIARHHEYGAPNANIPERSFIRSTFSIRRDDIIQVQAQITAALVAGKITSQRALEIMGAWLVAAIQSTIVMLGPFIWLPLKPATIARKGSSAPLIDTGQMRQSLTWWIRRF